MNDEQWVKLKNILDHDEEDINLSELFDLVKQVFLEWQGEKGFVASIENHDEKRIISIAPLIEVMIAGKHDVRRIDVTDTGMLRRAILFVKGYTPVSDLLSVNQKYASFFAYRDIVKDALVLKH